MISIRVEVLDHPQESVWLEARCSAKTGKGHPFSIVGDPDYVFTWIRRHVLDHALEEIRLQRGKVIG